MVIGVSFIRQTFLWTFFSRTLTAHRVRRPSNSLVAAPALSEKSQLWPPTTAHRITLPPLQPQATKEERWILLHNNTHWWFDLLSDHYNLLMFWTFRPGCLVPTTITLTKGSRTPTPKTTRRTNRFTRATARRGKMYETPHKRISTDRGYFVQ